MQKITSLRYRVLPRLPGADPGIFITDGRGGGVLQTLVQKVLLNFFVVNYFSRRRPRVFHLRTPVAVGAGNNALRAEAKRS